MNTDYVNTHIAELNRQKQSLENKWNERAMQELADRGITENTPIEWGEYGQGYFSKVRYSGYCIVLYYHVATVKGLPSKTERTAIIKDTNEITIM